MKVPAVFILALALASANVLPDNKIVGGQNAALGQFPYQASLRSGNFHFCGGTILTSNRVLSAAHCNVYPASSVNVVVGTIDIENRDHVYTVSRFINHEQYDPNAVINDIAIIYLNGNINFNSNIQPARLPTANNQIGDTGIISGWGSTSHPGSAPKILQWATSNVVNFNQCLSTQVCILNKQGIGACSGDSGGPYARNGVVLGVASKVYLCALGLPDYYTSVYAFRGWVDSHL